MARARRVVNAHRWSGGTRKKRTKSSERMIPRSIGAPAYLRAGAATLSVVEGWLDWYLLGLVAGLGVADGALGRQALRPLFAVPALAFAAGAIAISLLALEWWAVLVFLAAAAISWIAFRRLSPAARPLAALAAAGIALVPLLGYALVLLVPLAGARLGRRADTRYAGLRVLAKD
jgi:hypothetical protein